MEENKPYKYKTANQSYYRLSNRNSNLMTRTDVPLFVNCCGESVIREEFFRQFPERRDYELIYMLGGKIFVNLDSKELTLEKGDIICFTPQTNFTFTVPAPVDEWARYYWLHFTGYEAAEVLLLSDIEPNVPHALNDSDDMRDYYERLFAEFRMRSHTFDYATSLILRSVLLLAGRLKCGRRGGKLDRSIRYIHTHIRYNLSVERLAEMEFLAVSRYRELFKEETGASPSEYITHLRIERAKDLLGQGNMSIDSVASSIGYPDRHYFQRVFKKNVGVTPGEYRKSLRDKNVFV